MKALESPVPFEIMGDEHPRTAFYEFVTEVGPHTPSSMQRLDLLTEYVEYLEQELLNVNFDQQDAALTAAEVGFRGVANEIEKFGTPPKLLVVKRIDSVFRKRHGNIPEGFYPLEHHDPHVAGFYAALTGTLRLYAKDLT